MFYNKYNGENASVKEKICFAGDYITPEGARPSFNRQGQKYSRWVIKKIN